MWFHKGCGCGWLKSEYTQLSKYFVCAIRNLPNWKFIKSGGWWWLKSGYGNKVWWNFVCGIRNLAFCDFVKYVDVVIEIRLCMQNRTKVALCHMDFAICDFQNMCLLRIEIDRDIRFDNIFFVMRTLAFCRFIKVVNIVNWNQVMVMPTKLLNELCLCGKEFDFSRFH